MLRLLKKYFVCTFMNTSKWRKLGQIGNAANVVPKEIKKYCKKSEQYAHFLYPLYLI